MALSGGHHLVVLTLLSLFFVPSHTWDSDDLELFDLVEEVNANFYDVFGIEQSASSQEVRKAYRKLSLQYHPDKNDAEDAEEKFRQIVAIYEVLKDEKKRERYNQVLVEGLPDWRQPVYYYRRARKMGIYELAIVLSVIITIGQYFVAWGVYVEKRLVMEEVLSSKKKKEKKKKKQSADDGANEEDELSSIPTPHILDLWPFRLSVFIFYTVYNVPQTVKDWQEERKRRKEAEEEAKALEEEAEVNEFVRKPKKRAQPEIPEYTSEMYAKFTMPTEGKKEPQSSDHEESDSSSRKKKGEWSDEEIVLLAKAVNKFPGAVNKRWEKIADMVGRSVPEVIAKAKETKGNYAMHLSTAVQSSASKSQKLAISNDIITQSSNDSDEVSGDNTVRKRHRPTKIEKTAERTLLISQEGSEVTQSQAQSDKSKTLTVPKQVGTAEPTGSAGAAAKEMWTQNQQTIFEWALKHYPKGTDKRWDLIAEQIPGKTKEDCIARFKILAELVSKRKKAEHQVEAQSS